MFYIFNTRHTGCLSLPANHTGMVWWRNASHYTHIITLHITSLHYHKWEFDNVRGPFKKNSHMNHYTSDNEPSK